MDSTRTELAGTTSNHLQGGTPSRARLAAFCTLLALAALLLPVALVRVPPMLDYPNHLARLWLLAGGMDAPPLSGMYAANWHGASTNIGADLLAATLGRLIGGDLLNPLLLAAALVLPPLGAILLNRAAFGGGWHWWQVGFAALAWNTTLVAGFLNFQLSLGLALLAAAADPWLSRRLGPAGAMLARMGLGGALLVSHAFAAAFYGVLLAGLVFGAEWRPFSSAAGLARAALRAAVAAGLAVGVPVLLFLLVAPSVPVVPQPPGVLPHWTAGYTLRKKLNVLKSGVVTYDQAVDLAFLAGLALAVLLALLLGLRRRAVAGPARAVAAPAPPPLRVHAGLLIATAGLLLLAVVTPSDLGGTACLDWRFPVMAVLAGAAALRPEFRSPRLAGLAACLLLLVPLGRAAWMTGIWVERQADIAALARALEPVPAGAAVLPVEHHPANAMAAPRGRYFFWSQFPTYRHFPALAVPWRRAFVPNLFAAPGKQPLRVLPPWDSMAVVEGLPAPIDMLLGYEVQPWTGFFFGYLPGWQERFDYVLVVNADLPHTVAEAPAAVAALPGLELVAEEGFARLYRIRRGPAASPSAALRPGG
jgi:hypothetical protein